MRVAYFVHDVTDAAVHRRVVMLAAAGAEVTVLGFSRTAHVPDTVAGAPVVLLGLTRDAAMIQRGAAVIRNLLNPRRLLRGTRGADVFIGRNLESLALARRAQKQRPDGPLVYECLDIHRLLLGSSLPARVVQVVEGKLLRSVDLLLTSSPAFDREYFSKRPELDAPVLLLENKVLRLDDEQGHVTSAPIGPPWKIGWFGMLRCARTFETLAALAERSGGRVEIEIAGRPSPAVFPIWETMVTTRPGITYHGPYKPDQLAALYGRCHFAWAVDWFEEGLNSKWLLPNRLYEAASHGVVPIALASVETGKWLERHSAGVTLDDDLRGLDFLLGNLTEPAFEAMRARITAIPRADLVADRHECETLVAALAQA